MVDLNDVISLEQKQRANLSYEARSWAIDQKIPSHTRASTIETLYKRYKDEPDWFIQCMIRSKTGLNDQERLVHERILKYYDTSSQVQVGYELPTPIGSVDFHFDWFDNSYPTSIIEVKTINSWKQAVVLLLYKRYFPDCELIAAFFGEKPSQEKQSIIRVALNDLGIHVFWVYDNGRLERFTGDNIPDEF